MVSETGKLTAEQKIFLEILQQTIHKGKYESEGEDIFPYLKEILRLSSIHMVFPMVVDALYRTYPERMEIYKKSAVKEVTRQAMKTASFVSLYQKMSEEKLCPSVIKGIVNRNLYHEPELRCSVDEDLFVGSDDINKYHDFLLKQGFQQVDLDVSLETADEISYCNPENHLYLEVHKQLFSTEDDIYRDMNKAFKILEEPVTIRIYDTEIQSIGYTDHLLYMICHAYKHLIYSGIGIRQLCDMTLFAEAYGKYIKWNRINEYLDRLNLTVFARAIMKICVEHLGMDPEKAGCSHLYPLCKIDELPLLEDILAGGIYGAQDENRLHSANMTLTAVSEGKKGKKSKGLRTSIFPSYAYMSGNFTYLKKYRFLLPLAWMQRIFTYLINTKKDTDPVKSIEIGKQRIELLKKYKLL